MKCAISSGNTKKYYNFLFDVNKFDIATFTPPLPEFPLKLSTKDASDISPSFITESIVVHRGVRGDKEKKIKPSQLN
jgi:hypothetical protein